MKRKSFSREMLSESEDSTHEDRLVGQHLTDIRSQTSYMTLLCGRSTTKRANQGCQVGSRPKGGSRVKATAVAASNVAKVNTARQSHLSPILFRGNAHVDLPCASLCCCNMIVLYCAACNHFCSVRDYFCSVSFAIISVRLYLPSFLFAICCVCDQFSHRTVLNSNSCRAVFPTDDCVILCAQNI